MAHKASIFRLDPITQSALLHLSKLLGRPMNKLVNEAVRDYLLNTSRKEREIAESLSNLQAYRERDLQVAEPSAAYANAPPASEVLEVAREFVRRVSARYPVKSAILFGSRARGSQRPESDVDIAVVLRGRRGKRLEASLGMADIAFDLMLETKLYIQPLLIWEEEWEHPDSHSNPRLLENIRRDGLPL